MRTLFIAYFILEFIAKVSGASHFYVSNTANGKGDGSFFLPWTLQQAMNAPPVLNHPKDTQWIWIFGGVYTNMYDAQTNYYCKTKGTESAPIIFRNFQNEKVTIDGNASITIAMNLGDCAYTWLWGLEILNSSTADRDHSNVDRPGNVYCTAENIKFINLIVHDLGSGLDSWKTAKNSETYGCIIYNIGNNSNNNGNWEGHGHGMYLQNDTFGIKKIHDNIVFNTYGYGIKIWQTTTTAAIGNFDIQGNIVFNGGANSENLGGVGNNYRTHNFFVVPNGPDNPLRNTIIKHNYTFSGVNTPRPPVNAFGLNYGVKNMVLDSNYFTGQLRLGFNNTPVFEASVRGNKIQAGIPTIYGYYLWGFAMNDFPDNEYIPNATGKGLEYFILPNRYEPNLSRLVMYNWDSSATISIRAKDLGLTSGDIYTLIQVMDYEHDVVTDTILTQDQMVNISMIQHTMADVIGSSKKAVSQFPVFGVFILDKIGKYLPSQAKDLSIIKASTFQLCPNPGRGKVKLQSAQSLENACVIVNDASGQRLKKFDHLSGYSVLLDLEELPFGIYNLQVSAEGISSALMRLCLVP